MATQVAQREAATHPLTERELQLMDAYWRACNYLSVGMM